jgi:cytoskeleton protein RodZ
MSQENTVEEPPTLGTFLRNHREQMGISLSEATESTRISARILKAIETDDFNSLPAETFSRGFYSIYAKFLELNPEEVLARYLKSRGQQPLSKTVQANPPIKNSQEFTIFEEPTSFPSVSVMNIIIVVALIAVATVCWSLNWNPATYISARLQNL